MYRSALFGATLLAGIIAMTSFASAQSCSALWHQRNSIFKDAGYCFKTPRAISTFGNAGRSFDSEYDLPLSSRDRATVNRIKGLERQKGC